MESGKISTSPNCHSVLPMALQNHLPQRQIRKPISQPPISASRSNKSLIWNNELSAKVLLYNTRLKKFMHTCPCMHMDHNSIKQEMSPKSKNTTKSINAYALVMVVTYSSEFKFVNTPNSSSHFGSSKPCSSSWLNKETQITFII
jgi:hypothetical protein